MKARESIYNLGNDYEQYVRRYAKRTPPGPFPPGPTPPEIDPIIGVSITLSTSGSKLILRVSGDLSTLSHYKLNVYDESGELAGTYILDKNSPAFDLGRLDEDYERGTYTLKATAVSYLGNNSPTSNGVEYNVVAKRTIWIKIRFLDKNYDPRQKELATGLACSRTDDIGIMEHKKAYGADWQLVDAASNTWMWGVTEGTNIDNGFAMVNGEQSTPLLIDTDWLDSIPDIMTGLDGYDRDLTIQWVNNGTWPIVPESEFTGKVNIVDWDLKNVTSMVNLFGGIPWVSNAIYGVIPGFTTNATRAAQMFGRSYHITGIDGAVAFPKGDDLIQAFYSMCGLTRLPKLTVADGAALTFLFGQCANVEDNLVEIFDYLFGTSPSNHDNTFTNCGIIADEHALDNIPVSWGGKGRILGTTLANGKEKELAAGDDIIKIY